MRKVFFIMCFLFAFPFLGRSQQFCDCPYPIIFVHGWAGDESSWLNYSKELYSLWGDSIRIPNMNSSNPTGNVFYANLNYEYGNTNYLVDVKVHDDFVNAPVIDKSCIYGVSFHVKKDPIFTQPVLITKTHPLFNSTTTNLPENESSSNQSSAFKQGFALGKAIEKIRQITGKDKVILIGHSMGGLAIREYLQRSNDGGITHPWWVSPSTCDGHKVQKVFTVGTPHLGSNTGKIGIDNQYLNDLLAESGFDLSSEAVRDLRYYYGNQNLAFAGVYLYGGSEGFIPLVGAEMYHNTDVNCNDQTSESIEGLNISGLAMMPPKMNQYDGTHENTNVYPLPPNIKYSYYVSNIQNPIVNFPDNSDGIVLASRQYLYDGNTIKPYLERNHFLSDKIEVSNSYHIARLNLGLNSNRTHETGDFHNLNKGLDEPDFPFFATSVNIDTAYIGLSQERADIVAENSNPPYFGSTGTNNNLIDADWYKVEVKGYHTGNFKFILNKTNGKDYAVDFFTSQTPDPYGNPIPGLGDLSNTSLSYESNQIILELGSLPLGTYYFRITSRVIDDPFNTDLNNYSFRIYDPATCISPAFTSAEVVWDNEKDLKMNLNVQITADVGVGYHVSTLPDFEDLQLFVPCGLPLVIKDIEFDSPIQITLTNSLNNTCTNTFELDIPSILKNLALCQFEKRLQNSGTQRVETLADFFCESDGCNYILQDFENILNRPSNNENNLPSALNAPLQDLYICYLYEELNAKRNIEFFGSLYGNDNFQAVSDLINPYFNNLTSISNDDSIFIQQQLNVFDLDQFKIGRIISKWNNTLNAWGQEIYAQDSINIDIIDKDYLDSLDAKLQGVTDYIGDRNLVTVQQLFNSALAQMQNFYSSGDPAVNAVCASTSISLSQKLTMTREAFEGTLKVFNGNPTTAMDSIKLNLVILNEDGVVRNDLFEIETISLEFLSAIDGTGTLAGDKEGIAKILFIPEIGAAPTVPTFYSFGGSISYIDPFGGVKVTMPLVPVTLQVNPSPNLFLHYFLQRDIISDDPLTPKIEPTIPASLAVMIENNGYGVASNLGIQSAQPQVIDNEKGLALNMNLIGSKLQGQPANMGLTNINFGNINPLSAKVGEWIFSSNVLGHFTGYQTAVRHLSSRGNPDLSLIEGAELHEWIKSIKVYGAQEDGINDFLVNAVPDANDYPDAIYLSQGNLIEVVSYADDGNFSGTIEYPAFTNTLHVNPSESVWDYIRLNDPGDGAYDLVSVTRNADNQVIPLDNAWLSFVTIPDTKVPVYENKFHFVDIFSDTLPKSYTVVWSPKDPNPPYIDTIVGAPIQVTANKINQLMVVFSEPIIDSTFNYLDIALTNQGGPNLVDNTVNITKIDSVSYQIDISSYTNTNGYFLFTVQSAGVKDLTGTPGFYAKQVSWTQFLTVPVVQEFIYFPQRGILSAFDTVAVRFNMPIDTTSLQGNDFFLLKDGTIISGMIGVTSISSDLRNFQLTGIHNILSTDGLYMLGINLKSIKSTTNIFGLDTQYHVFILDTKGPDIESITKLYTGSLDPQHVTGVKIAFDEEIIAFDTTSLLLFRNEVNVNMSPLTVQKISGTIYHVFWNPDESYPNGNYKLTIDETKFNDLTLVYGIGNDSIIWQTVRASGLIVSDVSISPDYGYSDSDRHTYQSNGTYHFTLNESGTNIRLFQQINSNTLLLLGSLATVPSGQITGIHYQLLSGANTALVLKVNDQFGNEVSHVLNLVIDEVALIGAWALPQNLNFVSHPDSIQFNLSRKVLNNNPSGTIVKMFRNNIEISASTFSVVALNDSTFRISEIPSIGNTPGNYKITFNVGLFKKHLSGRPGQGFVDLNYTIINSNLAPVANAGPDITITDLGAVQLDGSLSNDPNGDPLTYQWYSLDNLLLSNDSINNPTANVDETQIGKILTFLLVVNDGTRSASDLVRVYINLDDIIVKPKVLLEGPFDFNTGLMLDLLRQQNMIPLNTPYTDINKYRYGNDGKTIDPDVLVVEGANAVVDWVYVELFNVNGDSVIRGGSYLVQRDGDVVDVDGVSSLEFFSLSNSNYRMRIYHRNHLPVSTSSLVLLKLNEIKQLDLRYDYNLLFGGRNAVKIDGTYISMFSGDVNANGQIQNTDIILTIPQIGLSGYHAADTDMNGQIQNTDIQNYILPNLGRGKQF